MIKTENVTINNREFKRTYSDANKMIRKVGTEEIYSEAVDVLSASWQYEETDEVIVDEYSDRDCTLTASESRP